MIVDRAQRFRRTSHPPPGVYTHFFHLLMSWLKTLIASFAFGCLGTATVAIAKPDAAAQKIVNSIFDRDAFVALLPKHPVVGVDGKTPKKDVDTLRHALAALGKTPGVEFMGLPKGASMPKATRSFKADMPYEMKRDGISGGAIFLVLLTESGKAEAVYCAAYTDKAFANAGAEAIAQWKFEPAKIGSKVLPSILAIPLQFSPDADRSPFG